MTDSSWFNSNTNLESIDETSGNITDEAGDLSVLETNFDRQTHTDNKYCRSTSAMPADRLSLQERTFPDTLQTTLNLKNTELFVLFIT